MSPLGKALVVLGWGVLLVSAGFSFAGHDWPIYVFVAFIAVAIISRLYRRLRVAEDA